jgi:hypothetical protein
LVLPYSEVKTLDKDPTSLYNFFSFTKYVNPILEKKIFSKNDKLIKVFEQNMLTLFYRPFGSVTMDLFNYKAKYFFCENKCCLSFLHVVLNRGKFSQGKKLFFAMLQPNCLEQVNLILLRKIFLVKNDKLIKVFEHCI